MTQEIKNLIEEAREWASSYASWGDNGLVDRLVDALEAALGEPDGDREVLAIVIDAEASTYDPVTGAHSHEYHEPLTLAGGSDMAERIADKVLAAGFSRATVPDAATEVHDPKDLSIINGWLVEEAGEHTCGTGPDGYYGAHEPGCGYVPLENLAELDGWPEAERDAALAAIERVRSQHRVDEYTAGHTIVRCVCEEIWPCATIQALDGAPEPEWEWGVNMGWGQNPPLIQWVSESKADAMADVEGVPRRSLVRRRKAGPWLPVEGENDE